VKGFSILDCGIFDWQRNQQVARSASGERMRLACLRRRPAFANLKKVRFGKTPKPALGTSALPGLLLPRRQSKITQSRIENPYRD
jgi:hypothetical protein